MSDLISQRTLSRIIGQTRLRRLLRCGWIKPIERNGQAILFDPRDVRRALTQLERRRCPVDKIEVARVLTYRIKKPPKVAPPRLEAHFELDFTEFQSL